MHNIVVIDYGTSNLRSVAKALQHVADKQHRIVISDDPKVIQHADKIVFPGQGAIGQCMQQLRQQSLDSAIKQVIQHKPFLGICLGLQCLMDSSEEDGDTDCLSIIPGKVTRFVKDGVHKIPHMGWNQVGQTKPHALWQDIKDGERFYFVHSYYVTADNDDCISGTCHYINEFTAAVASDNIFACQFHPEKSQSAGLHLLHNFLRWTI